MESEILKVIGVIVINSMLGFLLAIADIRVSNGDKKWLKAIFRPWSFSTDTDPYLGYNKDEGYILLMTMLGPIPKLAINLIICCITLFSAILFCVIGTFFGALFEYLFFEVLLPEDIRKYLGMKRKKGLWGIMKSGVELVKWFFK